MTCIGAARRDMAGGFSQLVYQNCLGNPMNIERAFSNKMTVLREPELQDGRRRDQESGFSNTAEDPSSDSISIRRLYLAIRSLRQAEPLLI